jgi:hypothetical protein
VLPDGLWERVEWVLNRFNPPKPSRRKRAPARPNDDSTVRRAFRRQAGIRLFEITKSLLLAECGEVKLVDWLRRLEGGR